MTKSAIDFADHAITALPAALDALDAAEFDKLVHNSTIKQLAKKMLEVTNLTEDRDRWRARAEALERSIKSREANTSVLCHACFTCTHVNEDTIYCAGNCGRERKNWEFEEARFSAGGK